MQLFSFFMAKFSWSDLLNETKEEHWIQNKGIKRAFWTLFLFKYNKRSWVYHHMQPVPRTKMKVQWSIDILIINSFTVWHRWLVLACQNDLRCQTTHAGGHGSFRYFAALLKVCFEVRMKAYVYKWKSKDEGTYGAFEINIISWCQCIFF